MIGNTFFYGQRTVAVAANPTRVSQYDYSAITIKAKATNSNNIYVGDVNVNRLTGFILAAGQEVTLMVNNARQSIYICSEVNDEGVSFVAWGKIG